MTYPSTQNSLFWNGSSISPTEEELALGIQRITHWGGGGHSEVWKANMQREGATVPVALKIYRYTASDSPERLRKREERERIWGSLVHDNVAPLYAVYHLPDGLPVFVSPWCENGTADVYLREHPVVDPMKIIYEIACGMEYLHSRGIIHGDLKGQNVLIDNDGHARLIDFGLSRSADCGSGLTTTTTTTYRWCAPELFSDDGCPTTASDVYAFASTILELLTGNVPYSTTRGDIAVLSQILHGVTPRDQPTVFRHNVPQFVELWDLLGQCWGEPSMRPTISEVRSRLASFRD